MTALKPTFEDAVQLLANKPTPLFLATNSDLIYAGFQDLAARVANLEHSALEATFRLSALEDVSNATVAKLNAIETEHTAYKARVDALEKQPAASAKQLDDINTRLRTVEGAVGSSNFKKPLDKPADAAKPVPAPMFTPKPADPPVQSQA